MKTVLRGLYSRPEMERDEKYISQAAKDRDNEDGSDEKDEKEKNRMMMKIMTMMMKNKK